MLTTAVAQQAILVTGAGTMTDSQVNIECQLIVDEDCEIIRIPWRATVPALGVGTSANSSSSYNNFEGITDCYYYQRRQLLQRCWKSNNICGSQS